MFAPIHFFRTRGWFFYTSLLICLGYGLIESYLIPFSTIAADEFVFIRHLLDYTQHLPYLSFPPYKSALGHYLLAIPLFFSHDALLSIFYVKYEIALLNLFLLGFSCYGLTRLYQHKAVLIAMLSILANQLFIIHSTELRVDMLCSWLCLLSAISLLQQRPRAAGTLLGIALLVSQKAIWYIIAINAGVVACGLTFSNPIYSRQFFYTFNRYLCFTVFAYLAFWSAIAGPEAVLSNFFFDAYVQVGLTTYAGVYAIFWHNILSFSPLLFFLWPLTCLCLVTKACDNTILQRQLFVCIFSSCFLAFFISYKQAFPYNFVLTVPAFFILYTEFFNWLFTEDKPYSMIQSTWDRVVLLLIAICISTALVFLLHYLHQTTLTYIVSLLPILLAAYLTYPPKAHTILFSTYTFVISLVFSIVAIAVPFAQAVNASKQLNGHYQHTMIRLGEALLQDGGTYLGGVPFIYYNEQPVAGLKNLIAPQLYYLHMPFSEMIPPLLPSLYLSATTQEQVLADIPRHPIKFFYNNYRILGLPSRIRLYLFNHYQHYVGSIYLYSPTIPAGIQTIQLAFTGVYRVNGKINAFMNIDGHIVKSGELVTLHAGKHISSSQTVYRLALSPQHIKITTLPTDEKDDWSAMLKTLVIQPPNTP